MEEITVRRVSRLYIGPKTSKSYLGIVTSSNVGVIVVKSSLLKTCLYIKKDTFSEQPIHLLFLPIDGLFVMRRLVVSMITFFLLLFYINNNFSLKWKLILAKTYRKVKRHVSMVGITFKWKLSLLS